MADGERRSRRRMVHAGRLEVDVLERPPHRPVGLPDELALVLRREVGGAVVVAHRAGVGEVGGVVVVRRHRGRVAAAVLAVGLEREVAHATLVGALVVVRDRVGHRLRFLEGVLVVRLRRALESLRAVLRQHAVDVRAMAYGAQHLVAVDARPVALSLGDRLHLCAQGREGLEHRHLEVRRPRVVTAPRVGHGDQRTPDVLDVRRVDAVRHLAETVVVVPHVQVTDRHAAAAQLVGDEVRHQELAQVAQVHGSRGRDARRAGHGPPGTGALVVADRVVRGASHPVDGVLRGHGWSGSWLRQWWVPNATGAETRPRAWGKA